MYRRFSVFFFSRLYSIAVQSDPLSNGVEACSGQTGHTEGVRVVYDPNQISFVDILRWFWEAHDPASGMGQGNDRGSQYRSGFYYLDDEQQQLIVASKKAYETALGMDGTDQHITTEIAAATDYDQYGGLWYFGEPYHQQYLSKPGTFVSFRFFYYLLYCIVLYLIMHSIL